MSFTRHDSLEAGRAPPWNAPATCVPAKRHPCRWVVLLLEVHLADCRCWHRIVGDVSDRCTLLLGEVDRQCQPFSVDTEDILIDPIDTWLVEIFEPERVEHTLTQLEAAEPNAMATPNHLQRSITECDRKLAKHRAALEAGADPAMVAAWSSDVYRERAALVAQVTATSHQARPPQRMSRNEIRELVDALGGLLAILRAADPGDKLEVYRELGLKLNYNHETEEVTAETNLRPQVGVLVVSGGGHMC